MSIAIEFNNVSKSFRMERDKARSFQELFMSLIRRNRQRDANLFWSLRDVSFSVEKGETLGIVGSNGAGKSTSLKLISKIIPPTSGQITVNGRVTALLELGAGFHPELTGRDNIFLNGTVMGLSRKEIQYRMDQIIDFSEVNEFIDVPVKDYSSGMYARLGFSVAVHMNPEIVLLDEVLSVGDQAFQQKCNERMLRMRKQGVTTVLVSHSMDSVWRICSRAVWLDKGKMKAQGPAHKVVDAYYKYVLERSADKQQQESPSGEGARMGSGEVRISEVEFWGEERKARKIYLTNEPLVIRMHYKANQPIEQPLFGLALHHAESDAHLAGPNNSLNQFVIPQIYGDGVVEYCIDRLPFLPGEYWLTVAIYDKEEAHPYDVWHQCARFNVVPGGTQERYGFFALEGKWSHHSADPAHTQESVYVSTH